MKTSNILLSIAAVIFLSTMVAYDFRLKDQYLVMKSQGLEKYYKNKRFDGYKEAKVTSFSDIKLISANAMSVVIEHGEKQAVWVRKYDKERVSVLQKGNTLILDLNKQRDTTFEYGDIVIISPQIKKISTTTFNFPEFSRKRYGMNFEISVNNLSQDSLAIIGSADTHFSFKKNKLKLLEAVIGDESGNGKLHVSSDNDIESVKVNAKGKSTVELLDSGIKNIEHSFSDGAVVTFRGKILPKL